MEHDLIALAAQGDTTAFARLVEQHGAMMARVLLRDAAAAEDATQEAWVDVCRASDQASRCDRGC